jgi:hypothetical protein
MMTKQGGATLVATMIEKYGSYEAFRESMRERASKGGKNGNKKLNPNYAGGFAGKRGCLCDIIAGRHIIAECAGKKGGSRKRGSKHKDNSDL